jgi:hypothetical protein
MTAYFSSQQWWLIEISQFQDLATFPVGISLQYPLFSFVSEL